MRWLHQLLMQCNMLLRRDRAGERLQDELQFHLDQQIAENLAAGERAPKKRAMPRSAPSATPPPSAIRPATPGAGNGWKCSSAIFDSAFALSHAIPASPSSPFWSWLSASEPTSRSSPLSTPFC